MFLSIYHNNKNLPTQNMITVQRNEQKVTCNATHFKKINSENECDDQRVNPDNRDKSDSNTTPVRSPINT